MSLPVLAAGGERYEYIPALNSRPRHIEMLSALVSENLQGWLDMEEDAAATQARARTMGAAD